MSLAATMARRATRAPQLSWWASARALSTRSPGTPEAAKDRAASSKPSGDEGSVRLVRWARFGKTLKPEDVGSMFAYGKLATPSAEPEAAASASSSLPTVRPRIKLNDPLYNVPKEEIVYTNVALLSRFVTETGAMLPRRRTGVSALKQRKLANAIKVARQMNLMPYLSKLPQHYDAKP